MTSFQKYWKTLKKGGPGSGRIPEGHGVSLDIDGKKGRISRGVGRDKVEVLFDDGSKKIMSFNDAKTYVKMIGTDYAGPVPESKLSRQDLEDDSSTEKGFPNEDDINEHYLGDKGSEDEETSEKSNMYRLKKERADQLRRNDEIEYDGKAYIVESVGSMREGKRTIYTKEGKKIVIDEDAHVYVNKDISPYGQHYNAGGLLKTDEEEYEVDPRTSNINNMEEMYDITPSYPLLNDGEESDISKDNTNIIGKRKISSKVWLKDAKTDNWAYQVLIDGLLYKYGVEYTETKANRKASEYIERARRDFNKSIVMKTVFQELRSKRNKLVLETKGLQEQLQYQGLKGKDEKKIEEKINAIRKEIEKIDKEIGDNTSKSLEKRIKMLEIEVLKSSPFDRRSNLLKRELLRLKNFKKS